MFGKVFKGFSKKTERPTPEPSTARTEGTESQADKPSSDHAEKEGGLVQGEIKTPEQLCGVTPEMDSDAIHEHLAMLYKRHNAAASSLDATLREEAEVMLDAIVELRQKLAE